MTRGLEVNEEDTRHAIKDQLEEFVTEEKKSQ